MSSLLSQADVVVNCSISGGRHGQLGARGALARPRRSSLRTSRGNRSLIEHGQTGLLFRDEAEFERGAAALVRDPELRGRLGRAGRELVVRQYRPTARSKATWSYRGLIGALV